jgi:3-oxoacyl-[acyl-carrier-protein] synthase-3
MRRSIVAGCGAYLPKRVVTNVELGTQIDTSDEWIAQRTGIRQRHIAADGELTSDLALAAARPALAHAGIDGRDLDLIVLATATPDNTFPATATRIQAGLGNKTGTAFDVQAVCTGFIYALAMADNMLRLGQADTALVIGAEVFSRILDWRDRTTCVLFGDGAGAVVLKAGEVEGTSRDRGPPGLSGWRDGRSTSRRWCAWPNASTTRFRPTACSTAMWTGWFRTRPICASSKARARNSICRSSE